MRTNLAVSAKRIVVAAHVHWCEAGQTLESRLYIILIHITNISVTCTVIVT